MVLKVLFVLGVVGAAVARLHANIRTATRSYYQYWVTGINTP